MSVRTFGLTLSALLALAAPAVAQDAGPAHPYDAATRTAIQGVIAHQIDAFNHDDGKAAEAFASPALQKKFPDPAQFLAMVKSHYAALVHPRSTSFGETEDSPHGPVQTVTVVAADGTIWKAIYALEKIGDEWRILGCGIERDETQQAI